MKYRQLLLGVLILALLVGSCKKEAPAPAEPLPPPPSPDTNFVKKQQIDIPWPGLADSPWPMFLHDPQHTGRSPYRGPQEGKMEWMFDAGHFVYSSPAIDQDGSIYFGADNRYFYSVSPAGVQKWRMLGGGSDSSPLIASDGTIYVLGRGASQVYSYFYSYTRNGDLNWQYIVDRMMPLSSPVISKDGETIFVAAFYLYAFRKDGTLRWKFDSGDSEGVHYSPAMSPDGATIYVPGYTALFAVDTSGTLKWQFPRGTSNPAVDNDGNIYFGAWPGVYSLNPMGDLRWKLDGISWGPEDPGPVIGRDGTIYITGRALYAMDYAGKLKWKYDLTALSQCVPALDIDGTIYFGRITDRTPADSINFLALNPNGTLRFQMCLRSQDGRAPDIDSRPAISSDGKIYVGSDHPLSNQLFKIK